MDRETLFKTISISNEKKLVMIVLDGLGGLPLNGRTELETAHTPNLDHLATTSECGLCDPISPGITPGSGPAHLSLFGYDPLQYEIGRGILEALGIGVKVGSKDVAVRGNFATLKDGLIIDRRAGRIPSAKNKEIIAYLGERIKEIENVQIHLYSGEEHRFVVKLSGEGLSDHVSDADSEVNGKPISYTQATSTEGEKTSRILNIFIDRLTETLDDWSPANTCLLRWCARFPSLSSMGELFQLKAAAIAVYPMYRGLAQLVGMEILETGKSISDQLDTLRNHYSQYDFFFVHLKKTDSYGEDGNFENKVKVIEDFDKVLPGFLDINPDVMVITGDHSTPALMKSHSWHPNPFLIKAQFQRTLSKPVNNFSEKICVSGVLGRFSSIDILPLMMANALKFKKYGA